MHPVLVRRVVVLPAHAGMIPRSTTLGCTPSSAPRACGDDPIVDKGNEWADLWAHKILAENGVPIVAKDSSSLDLTIDGVPWEVKSPSLKDGEPDDPDYVGFVESALRKAIKQFKKRGYPREEVRVVFNSKYRAASDEAIEAELKRRMETHGIREVLFVTKDGKLKRLINKK